MTEGMLSLILLAFALFLLFFIKIMEANEHLEAQISLLKGDNYGRNWKV